MLCCQGLGGRGTTFSMVINATLCSLLTAGHLVLLVITRLGPMPFYPFYH